MELLLILMFISPSASVTLYLLEQNTTRTGIDCPGDTLLYICSVLPNTERVDLIWSITLPGQMPIRITYDNTSILNNVDNLDARITTTLTDYRDDYIESVLALAVVTDITLNGSRVDCSITNMNSDSDIVLVSTSGKLRY